MKRRNKAFVFLAIGICLFIAAGVWLCYNLLEDQKAGQKSAHILDLLETNGEEVTLSPENETPVIVVEKDAFCGRIIVEKLEIKLPVYYEWTDENLKCAPCRYRGSVFTDDLIISGHNYKSHFGKLSLLKKDDVVTFIDPYGTEHHYKVSYLAEVYGTDISQMLSGNWDLTLFTCTLSGETRMAVRCQRISEK